MISTSSEKSLPIAAVDPVRGEFVRGVLLPVLTGLALMTVLSRISIPLGFTPVPITGQTLGVALCALVFGRKRGMTAVAAYLALGAAGVPLFALGKTGVSFGPTTGYLIGMLLAMAFLVTLGTHDGVH